jgi:hypothetical protein
LGSSGDIATDDDLDLARALGAEMASRYIVCVVGGDDGVMGAAARAAKENGGTTVAVTARDKQIRDGSIFDACVNTGMSWCQFSDALLRSCVGAVVIGGGAGTIAEIAAFYLAERPVAFFGGGMPASLFGGGALDARNLMLLPVVDSPDQALAHVLGVEALPQAAASAHSIGDELHLTSYPFGTAALYGEAAAHFRWAAIGDGRDECATAARASLEDALGDVQYYGRQDFFGAATHYARALAILSAGDGPEGFSAYLRAIMLESLASGLHDCGMNGLAHQTAAEAAHAYDDAISVSPQNEHKYLRHSAEGLRGDAHLFHAHALFEDGLSEQALVALTASREAYAKALAHHPPYGENVSASNYERVVRQVAELEARIAQAAEGAFESKRDR